MSGYCYTELTNLEKQEINFKMTLGELAIIAVSEKNNLERLIEIGAPTVIMRNHLQVFKHINQTLRDNNYDYWTQDVLDIYENQISQIEESRK